MNTVELHDWVETLPRGRARSRYQNLANAIGDGYVVNVPWCDLPMWLVQDNTAAIQLMRQGMHKWRIWTLNELRDLLEPFGEHVDNLADSIRMLERA